MLTSALLGTDRIREEFLSAAAQLVEVIYEMCWSRLHIMRGFPHRLGRLFLSHHIFYEANDCHDDRAPHATAGDIAKNGAHIHVSTRRRVSHYRL